MADITLTQAEADALITMAKLRIDTKRWEFPKPGEQLAIPLASADKREHFLLDITRARIRLSKITHQNRARQAIVLMRLDIDGPTHRNPDGQEIPCPHLHVYREGFGDKWAIPAPLTIYPDPDDMFPTFRAFMAHCNVMDEPNFNVGLFV